MIQTIQYVCVSHTGLVRRINQDNFICGRQYRSTDADAACTRLSGILPVRRAGLFGVFDGMGGLPCGDTASLCAAAYASTFKPGSSSLKAMKRLCADADAAVRAEAAALGLREIGTTAVLLCFSGRHAAVCSVGDSRVYRFADGMLTQVSVDHVVPSAFGGKLLLSQNLGMLSDAGTIAPYARRLRARPDEVFLLCSDGLTDMLPDEEIRRILTAFPCDEAADRLLDAALDRGGRDNITIMICIPRCTHSKYDEEKERTRKHERR